MITPLHQIAVAILLSSTGALLAALSPPTRKTQLISVSMQMVAGLSGLTGAIWALFSGSSDIWLINWGLPFGSAEIGVDLLSAFFLIPLFIVTSCASLYSLHYYHQGEIEGRGRQLHLFSGLLTASIALIFISRHSLLFLFAWELMALFCYFAMTVDDRKKEVREAGLLYLVTAQLGAMALFVAVALLKGASGGYSFVTAGSLSAGSGYSVWIFCAALMAFGMKAGIMPLHVWLPSAHANAPSHISAIMSGVMIKTGIYGIIRFTSFFDTPPFWWGAVILIAGIISGVIGVIFAIAQHDIKRLLAYHSIENIGIICIGIGLSLIGASHKMPLLILLGLSGALLHTLNHALFKSLLFLGAGSVIHGCGTREINKMGGLIKKMPWTAAFFLTGAVAICGLPPLNGFVSEWLIYLGLFRGILDADTLNDPFCAIAVASLALIGALALACFVKVFGVVFLGSPRSVIASEPKESGRFMLWPMGFIALLCLLIGIFPTALIGSLERIAASLHPSMANNWISIVDTESLTMISISAIALLAVAIIFAFIYLRRLKSLPRSSCETWGCGYLAPTTRMQYTASSFASGIIALFSGVLRPHIKKPVIKGIFADPSTYRSHQPETLLEEIYLPLFSRLNSRLSVMRQMQHGKLNIYILYIVATVVALLLLSHFTGVKQG